jgi:hypothetical protein
VIAGRLIFAELTEYASALFEVLKEQGLDAFPSPPPGS